MTEVVDNRARETAFRAAIYPKLEKRYGFEFLKQLFEICFRVEDAWDQDQIRENQINFLYEFDQIISGYKKRINDPEYFARIASCLKDLEKVAGLLNASVSNLLTLDSNHLQSLCTAIGDVAPPGLLERFANPKNAMNWSDVLSILKKAATLAVILNVSLALVAGNDLRKRGRGNQPLPYFFATNDLMWFWEKWTGEAVPFAKAVTRGPDKGKPEQMASEFVRLGLTMIDPQVTAANAITSINKVRNARKLLLDDLARLRGGANLLREYTQSLLRSLAAEDSAGSIPLKT